MVETGDPIQARLPTACASNDGTLRSGERIAAEDFRRHLPVRLVWTTSEVAKTWGRAFAREMLSALMDLTSVASPAIHRIEHFERYPWRQRPRSWQGHESTLDAVREVQKEGWNVAAVEQCSKHGIERLATHEERALGARPGQRSSGSVAGSVGGL